MHAMLWLVVVFLSTACLYVLLRAEFVAVIQVMVYTGGILILYMFAIMLVDIRPYKKMVHFHPHKKTTWAVAITLFIELVVLITSQQGFYAKTGTLAEETATWGGNSEVIGKTLFTDFILPFELIAIVLLVAIVGAVVLGRVKERSSLLEDK